MDVDIKAIKDRFVSQLSPNSIYLFGSHAKGTETSESDYDFYIVMPDDAGDQIALLQRAYRSIRGLKRKPVDIVLNYDSNFKSRASGNTLENIVLKEGVLLYEQERKC